MEDDPPWTTAFITLWNYSVLILFGFIRDFFEKKTKAARVADGYAPLLQDWEDFYTRRSTAYKIAFPDLYALHRAHGYR